MKKLAVLGAVVFVSAALSCIGISAPLKTTLSLKGVSSVDSLKKLSFPYSPVMAQPDASDTGSGPSEPQVSDAYKTGTGVVMSSAKMSDSDSRSMLTVMNARLTSGLMQIMQCENDPYAYLQIAPTKNSSATLATAMYERLPSEQKTYMLTIKLESDSHFTHMLDLRVGGTSFEGDKLNINPATKEIRVLFTYAAANNRMNVTAQLHRTNNLASDLMLKFYYIQLVQID